MKLSALHALQKLMARPDAAEVFKQFDTDGDGTVRDPYTPGSSSYPSSDALLGRFPGVLLGYVPVTLGQHLPAWLFPVARFRFWLLVLLCAHRSVCAQVDKAELQQGMAQIGNPVSDAELAEIMRLCDKDGDGSCDCELQSYPCSVALLRLLAYCSWWLLSMIAMMNN